MRVVNAASELIPTRIGMRDADGNEMIVPNRTIVIPVGESANLRELISPHANTRIVMLQLDGQIRMKTDGSAPTAQEGLLFGEYDNPAFGVEQIVSMNVISAGDAEVHAFVTEWSY